MTKNIIVYFGNTDYSTKIDKSLSLLKECISDKESLFTYDGSNGKGSCLFTSGVEVQANLFINDLKKKIIKSNEKTYQVNFVAHSKSAISALLAIKKIQADPDLKKRIKVTIDLSDPVPDNFQFTTKVAGSLAIANRVNDLFYCDIVKKVHITLEEKACFSIASDALVSKFHPDTVVEIETLPTYNDVQIEEPNLLTIRHIKTLDILKADGHSLASLYNDKEFLQVSQIEAYDKLVIWAKQQSRLFDERELHFDGRIIANNHAKANLEVINWRHAQLKKIVPDNILYGTQHPNYNFKKNMLEQACDLFSLLGRQSFNLAQQEVFNMIKDYTRRMLRHELDVIEYNNMVHHTLIVNPICYKAVINRPLNFLLMHGYLAELHEVIETLPFGPKNPLYESVRKLAMVLKDELASNINSCKTIQQIKESDALKIAHNTAQFIRDLYAKPCKPDQLIQLCDQYVKSNSHYGHHWSLGSKIITGALFCLAATAAMCFLGGFLGLLLSAALHVSSLETLFSFILLGAFSGGKKGLFLGIYSAKYFFHPSSLERQVKTLANAVKSDLEEDEVSEIMQVAI